jgi:glycosyltransferase involved in cell wall biosynthesis
MFSVVMPIYNHAKFVAQAVCSALRCPLVEEILLLDDGSADGSAAIASSMAAGHPGRVRNLTRSGGGNRGAHQRLNELVESARSEWIAVLNSDDVFVSGRFEAILADPGFPQCDFVFGNLLLMNERGALVGAKRGPLELRSPFGTSLGAPGAGQEHWLLDLLSRENYLLSTSNMTFRKALHARVGGFAVFRYVHDWDFALRAMSLGRPLYVQRFLAAYRRHPHNTTLEDPANLTLETKLMFDRFTVDFPEIAGRPGFRAGLRQQDIRKPTLL